MSHRARFKGKGKASQNKLMPMPRWPHGPKATEFIPKTETHPPARIRHTWPDGPRTVKCPACPKSFLILSSQHMVARDEANAHILSCMKKEDDEEDLKLSK